METIREKKMRKKNNKKHNKKNNKKNNEINDYDIYHNNLSYTKKLTFITNFIYRNIKETRNIIYKIEEFESDYEEIIDDVTYDSSDFFSE